MRKPLSPNAQAIVDAGLAAARESNNDPLAIDRAVEKATVKLSWDSPPGYKSRVTDALIEIAQAHVRLRLERAHSLDSSSINQGELVAALMDVTGRTKVVVME